jgi:two-component sensor histidine kinase
LAARAREATRRLPLSTRLIVALALLLAPLGISAALVAIAGLRDLDAGRTAVAASKLNGFVRAFDGSLGRDFAMLETVMLTGQAIDGCAVLADVDSFDARLDATQRFSVVGQPLCGGALTTLPEPVAARLRTLGPGAGGRFLRSVVANDGALWLLLRDNGARGGGGAVVARLPLAALKPLFGPGIGRDTQLSLAEGGRTLVAWGHDTSCGPLGHGCIRVRQMTTTGPELVLEQPADKLGFLQLSNVLLPVIMWLAALAIGWIAAHRIVVGPMLGLRETVVRYGAGDLTARAEDSRSQAREIAELGAAFDALADELGEQGAELRQALGEQRRLTREVHHRVKNNLQIINSLLSIQARDAESPEAARAYAMVQGRVGALALVHRWMYEDDAVLGVDARALTTDLCAALEHSLAAAFGTAMSIRADVGRIAVSQDTAVPLAFLIGELLSLAAAISAPQPVAATVTGAEQDRKLILRVDAAPLVGDPLADRHDAAARIVQGMTRQLRGKLVATAHGYEIAIPLG